MNMKLVIFSKENQMANASAFRCSEF